jgi:WD40 repeat protein
MSSADPLQDGEMGVESPYVGPRPFERAEAGLFFGRDRELRTLLSLVVAHRVVLLYAASGAGKTSLLSAGLLPRLEKEEEFEVLPIARVRGPIDAAPTRNAFAGGVIAHLAASETPEATIPEILAARDRPLADGFPAPRALVIDQLEELFTVHQERWRERTGFVGQLADALEDDPLLRIVIAIREDYLAHLDPFADLLGGLRTRLRLELLRPDAARAAVVLPLQETGRTFAPGTAESLVRDLLRVRIDVEGRLEDVEGEFVEPVQLQVACHSLWSALPPDVTVITDDHLAQFGDVDEVLALYYSAAVSAAARVAGMAPFRLRDQVERAFITPIGTRGTAYGTQESTAEIPAAAIEELERRHLVRAERARGARWYELTHDRLIEPIRASNRAARSERQRRRRRNAGIAAAAAVLCALLVGAAFAARRDAHTTAAAAALAGEVANSRLAERAVVALLNARSPLASAAFSPNGQRVITAGGNGAATIWDTFSGQRLMTLPGEPRLTSASFDPSGQRILTTSTNGTVRLWNWRRLEGLLGNPVRIQEEQRRLGVVPDGVLGRRTIAALKADPTVSSVFVGAGGPAALAGAFSSDSPFLAYGDASGRVRVLRVANGEPQATVTGWGRVESVGFSSRSSVVFAGAKGAVDWDWRTRKVRSILTRAPATAAEVAGPCDTLSLTVGAKTVIRRGAERVTLPTLPGTRIVAASFAPDGRSLVASNTRLVTRVWNLRVTPDGIELLEAVNFGGPRRAITSASFSRDGTLLIVASRDGTARVVQPFGDAAVVPPLSTAPGRFSEFTIPDAEGALANDGQRYHAGKDWFAPGGSVVRAPVRGKVVEAKPSRGTTGQVAGGTVKIEARDGKVWVFRFVDPTVRVGRQVLPGQQVATVTRWRDGSPHIHMEVWKTLAGGYDFENMLDPMIFFRPAAGSAKC